MQLLDGKVAIIAGASSGMGAATARLFAAQGARVVLGALAAPMRLQALRMKLMRQAEPRSLSLRMPPTARPRKRSWTQR